MISIHKEYWNRLLHHHLKLHLIFRTRYNQISLTHHIFSAPQANPKAHPDYHEDEDDEDNQDDQDDQDVKDNQDDQGDQGDHYDLDNQENTMTLKIPWHLKYHDTKTIMTQKIPLHKKYHNIKNTITLKLPWN